MIRRLLLLAQACALSFACALPAAAQSRAADAAKSRPVDAAKSRPVDAAKSRIAFIYTIDQKVKVEGRFPKFSAQIAFDDKQPEKGSVRLDIDLGAIDTGSADGDSEARRPLWFDVPKFPVASFVSNAIRKTGEGRYEAAGKLTIKGKTRDAAVPFAVTALAGGGLGAQGQLNVKRLLFDVGTGQWSDVTQIADEVEVRFALVLGPAK